MKLNENETLIRKSFLDASMHENIKAIKRDGQKKDLLLVPGSLAGVAGFRFRRSLLDQFVDRRWLDERNSLAKP